MNIYERLIGVMMLILMVYMVGVIFGALVDIKTLQTQTEITHPAAVRKLMSECNGVFGIKQRWVDGELKYFIDDSECEK